MQPYGITIPFDGIPLSRQRELVAELPDLGYTDVPLALASVWAPTLRLGTAIVPAYTRGPATVAQCAAALAAAAPGRFALGIGTSTEVIVERWNAGEFVSLSYQPSWQAPRRWLGGAGRAPPEPRRPTGARSPWNAA